jgi:hypothetical protein
MVCSRLYTVIDEDTFDDMVGQGFSASPSSIAAVGASDYTLR